MQILVVSTGDILDMSTNNVEYAFITGRNINLDNKHKQLYRRFQAKYEKVGEGNTFFVVFHRFRIKYLCKSAGSAGVKLKPQLL